MSGTQPSAVNPGFASPPTGLAAGGTPLTSIAGLIAVDTATLSQIYVGNVAGGDPTNGTSGFGVTTPPSAVNGAVDLTVQLSDGVVGVIPEGFSYGPTILEVVPNGATAEGGQQGAIIGYGFGTKPADVQVTVNGQAAPVTTVHTGPFIDRYSFPVNELQFTIPPGNAGTAVDVTVTTAAGSTTAKDAFHYVDAVTSYPTSAVLQAGIYDPHRDLYYFTGQTQIQVLSKTEGKGLSPISLPGTGAKTQLLAISESPDGSKLAVSDFGGQAIYVLNPDSPATAVRYAMPPDYGSISLIGPSGLAVTDAGIVYFAAEDTGGHGNTSFLQAGHLHRLYKSRWHDAEWRYSRQIYSGSAQLGWQPRVLQCPRHNLLAGYLERSGSLLALDCEQRWRRSRPCGFGRRKHYRYRWLSDRPIAECRNRSSLCRLGGVVSSGRVGTEAESGWEHHVSAVD